MREVVAELKAKGIYAGNFYWFDNNWHYVRKWQHLKNNATLGSLNDSQKAALAKLADTDFAASDAVMSRCISTAISLVWTEEQVQEKGNKMVAVIKGVVERKLALA